MKREIRINPRYEHLRTELEQIPLHSYEVKHTYCNRRNVVELARIGRTNVVIKHFRRPNALNALVYDRFRPSKARRSYDNALRLPTLGIDTPEPVALITDRCAGLLTDSWYISLHVPAPPIGESVTEADRTRLDSRFQTDTMLKAFGKFALTLFEKGIFQHDFNRSNFLVENTDGNFRFYMVDINRMEFRPLTPAMIAICWVRFGADLTPGLVERLTLEACEALGLDATQGLKAAKAMIAKGARREKRRQIKRWWRRHFHS